MKKIVKELKTFLLLWSTQSLSQMGSAMTGFALTLWLYEHTGSALQTSLLAICTYAPYVLVSIFAGALSDRWDKKKTMLVADSFAAVCTLAILLLYKGQALMPVHLYIINVLSGFMNTVQQPASEVAMTLITPKEQYQRASGLGGMSRSLNTILSPIFATALYSLFGMDVVIAVDLLSFGIAFCTLLFAIRIPKVEKQEQKGESLWISVKGGLSYLHENPLVLTLILFLAGVNLVASVFDATLPAFVLPKKTGGETVLGLVTACSGIAMLVGSAWMTVLPKPKNRVRVIYVTMLFSLSIENFMLALSDNPVVWCVAQVIGWCVVPVMSANMDVVLRTTIPVHMQGRVYACRNSLQYFTIPIGLFLGGILVDDVCEPVMAIAKPEGLLVWLFGIGKGSGASMLMFFIGVVGTIYCLVFGKLLNKYRFEEGA